MPCPSQQPNITLTLDKPSYSPGDQVNLQLLSDIDTFATIRVIDMSAYLEVDQKKKGEVSHVAAIMVENEVWQKYGTKGELWYSTQYVDWMYKSSESGEREDGMMHLELILGLQS